MFVKERVKKTMKNREVFSQLPIRDPYILQLSIAQQKRYGCKRENFRIVESLLFYFRDRNFLSMYRIHPTCIEIWDCILYVTIKLCLVYVQF
mgnify:CR=1 FL=1